MMTYIVKKDMSDLLKIPAIIFPSVLKGKRVLGTYCFFSALVGQILISVLLKSVTDLFPVFFVCPSVLFEPPKKLAVPPPPQKKNLRSLDDSLMGTLPTY